MWPVFRECDQGREMARLEAGPYYGISLVMAGYWLGWRRGQAGGGAKVRLEAWPG